jgi:hypothetical protein
MSMPPGPPKLLLLEDELIWTTIWSPALRPLTICV